MYIIFAMNNTSLIIRLAIKNISNYYERKRVYNDIHLRNNIDNKDIFLINILVEEVLEFKWIS